MKLRLPGEQSILLNPVTLSFSREDKDVERDFLDDYNLRSLVQIRVTLSIAILFYMAFGILDYLLFPNFIKPLLFIRFCVFSPFAAAIILLSFSKSFRPYLQLGMSFTVVVAGVGITSMIYIASPLASSLYYPGLILVMVFGYTFARARFIYAAVSGWIIVLSYEVIYILSKDLPIEVFINNNFFLLGSHLVGMFACYSIELSQRRRFYMNRILEHEHEKLNDMNRQLDEMNQALKELSRTDELTNIANRRMFEENMVNEWARAMRDRNPVCLIMLDVDFFKQYNDRFGHQMGDECLRSIADALAEITRRPADLPARYGGEEFAVILPNITAENGVTLAQRLRKKVEDLRIDHGGSNVSDCVTISLGVACMVPERGHLYEEIVEKADKALYKAKEKGRNQVVLL